MVPLFGFLSLPAPTEMVILLMLAVLLFGRNLPEVLRKLGKQYGEIRRMMKNVENEFRRITSEVTTEVNSEANAQPTGNSARIANSTDKQAPAEEPTAPKFEPPP